MRMVMILAVLGLVAYLMLERSGGEDPVASTAAPAQVLSGEYRVQDFSLTAGTAAPGGYAVSPGQAPTREEAQRILDGLGDLGAEVRIYPARDGEGMVWSLIAVGQHERLDQAQVAQASLVARHGARYPWHVIRLP